jgi:hypothetical protein
MESPAIFVLGELTSTRQETMLEPNGQVATAPAARAPIDPGIDEQFMFHPTRAQVDPGSIWLRNFVVEIGRGLDLLQRRAA